MGQGAPFCGSSHVLFSLVQLEMKLYCPKANTDGEGLGAGLTVGYWSQTYDSVQRLKLCCGSACLHCAPLCTTIKTAMCCRTVVILWLMRNVTIMLPKSFKKSYIIATKSVSPNVQEAQLRKAAPTCPSKRAIAAVLQYIGVCVCVIVELWLFVFQSGFTTKQSGFVLCPQVLMNSSVATDNCGEGRKTVHMIE